MTSDIQLEIKHRTQPIPDIDQEVKDTEPEIEEADIAEFIPEPPDGGWGWVIVLASFMNHFILDGVCYAFGVFLLTYEEVFQCTQAQAGALMSTLIGVYLLSAPIASALVNKFGCRSVGMFGSILAAGAFLASTTARSINAMILILGVIGGFGFGMMYLPAVISVSVYFEKRRAIATGIAMCGTGFGAFCAGPFGKWIMEEYGWKGAHYIIAGVVLHGVVFSALVRPLITKHDLEVRRRAAEDKNKVETNYKVSSGDKNQNSNGTNGFHQSQPNMLSPHRYDMGSVRLHRSVAYLGNQSQPKPMTLTIDEANDLKRPMYKKNVFYSGSAYQLSEYREQTSMQDFVTSIVSLPAMREEVHVRYNLCNCRFLPRQIADTLNEMLDLSLLLSFSFDVIIFAVLIIMLAYFIPFAYCSLRAIDIGIDKTKASFIVSILGISTMVGRIGAAALAQLPQLRPIIIHNVFLFLAGLSCLLIPFCKDYITISISAFCYAAFMGGHVSLSSIVLVDLLGLQRLTTAYGLMTLVRGISSLAGPPLGGYIFDTTQNYDSAFFMAGGLIIISTLGFIIVDLDCVKRGEANQQDDHETHAIDLPDIELTEVSSEGKTNPISLKSNKTRASESEPVIGQKDKD